MKPTLLALALLAAVSLALPARAQTNTWRWLQPTPTGGDLRDIAFANDQRGYAVGADGLMLATTDGGVTWQQRPTPAAPSLVAVAAAGQLVVAVGPGVLLRSTDAGATFTLTAGTIPFVDVQVLSSTRGFAAASDGGFYETTDGFATVTRVGTLTSHGSPRALWMVTDSRGWVVGGAQGDTAAFIATTNDAGRTWTREYTGIGGPMQAITGVGFAGRAVILAAGASVPRAVVKDEFQQTDWQQFELPGEPITALTLKAVEPEGAEIWVAEQAGLWGIRVDDDALQRPITQSRPRLWSVASPAVGTAIAVGDGGTIVRATYGQAAAVTVAGNRKERFTAADFPTADGQFGVFVDNQPGAPRLWVTRNGGASLQGTAVAAGTIADVSFVDANTGFGVLENGEVYATVNGGNTFQRMSTVTTQPKAISFVDGRTGYLAGNGLWRTTDAGVNWQAQVSFAQGGTLRDVKVRGEYALAVNTRGEIWQRTSGIGAVETWGVAHTHTQGALTSVDVLPDGRWVAGGQRGATRGVVVLSSGAHDPLEVAMEAPVLSVAASNGRFFALQNDGRIFEVASSGSLRGTFESSARLSSLASRSVADVAGNTSVAAPVAVGDFGALLVFDGSSTTNQPPVVTMSTDVLELGPDDVGQVSATGVDPEGAPVTYEWVPHPLLTLSATDTASISVRWAGPVPAATVATLEVIVCDPQNACQRGKVLVSSGGGAQPNRPPVARASGASVTTGSRVMLSGLGSTDPDNDPLTFKWEQKSGEPVTLQGADAGTLVFTAPLQPGTLVFELTVCDPEALCSRAEVVVTVIAPNQNAPPVAVAGAEQQVQPGQLVTLDGLASHDPEGAALTFAWRQTAGPTVELHRANTAEPSFTAGDAGDAYRFVLRVCDLLNACAEAGVNVFVGGMPPPPLVADAGADRLVEPGETVTLRGSASEPVTNWIWLLIEGVPVELQHEPGGPELSFLAPATPGRLVIQLTVHTADGRSATDTVAITVNGPVKPVANAGLDQTVGYAARVTLDGRRSADPLHRPLTFTWTGPEGVVIAGASSALASFFAPAADASLDFTLTVCATAELCATDEVRVVVRQGANLPPLPHAGPDRVGHSGRQVALDGTGSRDPEGRPLVVTWTQISGPGASIDAPASLWTRVTLPLVTAPTVLEFELEVCDEQGACAVDRVQVETLPLDTRSPLLSVHIVGAEDGVVPEDAPFDLEIALTCPAAACAPPRVHLEAGPPLQRVTTDGVTWKTPPVARTQPFTLRVLGCDVEDNCTVQTLDGLVLDTVNESPVALVRSPLVVRSRQPLVLDALRSYDPNGEPLSFLWTQREGPEVSLPCAQAGRCRVPFDGVPGDVLVFDVEVCDARDACDTASVEITVEDGEPYNRAPEAEAGDDRVLLLGQPLWLDGGRSFDPDGDELTFAWRIPDDPRAQLLEADTVRAELVVTEPLDAPLPVTLEVCDALGACASDALLVTVVTLPADDATASVRFGEQQQPCGCSGADPVSLTALGALALLLRRKRR